VCIAGAAVHASAALVPSASSFLQRVSGTSAIQAQP
jgi:hypothetical protein